jgi:predicted MFS family arabinose efflux permease
LFSLSQRGLILIILNAVYFFVYFHRTSTAVLAPYFMEEFNASAASLGGMSAAYFYPYALSQPIVGYLTDRWGPRKVITFSTAIGSLGAFLFGLAPTLFLAAFGRGLIGLGAAGVFVPALKALLSWFGPRAFAQMNGILLVTGNLAAIIAATPFAWIIQKTGWRASFFCIAGIAIVLTFSSWIYVRDYPPGHVTEKTGTSQEGSGGKTFVRILKNPFFWTLVALFFTYSGSFQTFQGLWGYPFLIDVFGYDKLQASNFLLLIAIGVIVGGPILSYLTDKPFSQKKGPMLSFCIGVQVLIWSGIVFGGKSLGSISLGIFLFAMGATLAGTLSILWAIIREVSAPARLGTVMGLVNPAPFLGVAIFQPATGYLMDRIGKTGDRFPFEAYQNGFGLCLVSLSIAFIISLFVRKGMKSI